MDLKKMEYLESIYRLQSFSKAADEHFISQPSISNAMRKLEEELGVTLIARDAKPLTLTMEGFRFLSHIYRILGDVNTAQSEMKSIAAERKKQINILVHSTIGDWTVSQMAMDFPERHPQYLTVMSEALGDQMLYMLEHDNMDIAYTLIPDDLNYSIFEAIPVIDCFLNVLLPEGHALLEKEKLTLEDLRDETIISFPRGSFVTKCLISLFEDAGIKMKLRTPGPINIITQLVQEGYGAAFITTDCLSRIPLQHSCNLRRLDSSLSFSKGFILKKERRTRVSLTTLIDYVKESVSEQILKSDAGR